MMRAFATARGTAGVARSGRRNLEVDPLGTVGRVLRIPLSAPFGADCGLLHVEGQVRRPVRYRLPVVEGP